MPALPCPVSRLAAIKLSVQSPHISHAELCEAAQRAQELARGVNINLTRTLPSMRANTERLRRMETELERGERPGEDIGQRELEAL